MGSAPDRLSLCVTVRKIHWEQLLRGMGLWLGAAVFAVGLLALAVWLANLALPFTLSDRVAIGLATGTALDGLVGAWLTSRSADGQASGRGLGRRGFPGGKRSVVMATHEQEPPDSASAGLPAAPSSAARPSHLALTELSRLTDLLLDVREIRSPVQWQLFLDALPDDVTQSTPRPSSGRMDVIALLRTCEEFPEAWDGLDAAIRLIAPRSPAALAVSAELRRLRLLGGKANP
jgi:Effector-associated domain 2